VGSTNRRADRELVEELRRFGRGEAFDERPMPDLDSEALDFRAASESFGPSMGLVNWVVSAAQIDPKLGEIVEKAFHASRTATGHAKWLLPHLSTRTRAR